MKAELISLNVVYRLIHLSILFKFIFMRITWNFKIRLSDFCLWCITFFFFCGGTVRVMDFKQSHSILLLYMGLACWPVTKQMHIMGCWDGRATDMCCIFKVWLLFEYWKSFAVLGWVLICKVYSWRIRSEVSTRARLLELNTGKERKVEKKELEILCKKSLSFFKQIVNPICKTSLYNDWQRTAPGKHWAESRIWVTPHWKTLKFWLKIKSKRFQIWSSSNTLDILLFKSSILW